MGYIKESEKQKVIQYLNNALRDNSYRQFRDIQLTMEEQQKLINSTKLYRETWIDLPIKLALNILQGE